MNILITGGLGFIGRELTAGFLRDGHHVTVIALSPSQSVFNEDRMRYISADTSVSGDWQSEVARQDIIINLAGASIFQRWTGKHKKSIYDSRILTTRNLVDALPRGGKTLFISTSAVGYYGPRGDEILTEGDSPGNDFLAKVCLDWEKEALRAQRNGVRVVITRFGLVLGKTGGTLGVMLPLFRRFLGGRLGSGKQWFSWVHVRDVVGALRFIVEHDAIKGPVNVCAPSPVTNRQLTIALSRILKKPALFTVPAFALRITLGEFAGAILTGQRVAPAKLERCGFSFQFPALEGALRDIVNQ